MEAKTLHPQTQNTIAAQKEIIDILGQHFFQGNFEHQLSLVSNALVDIVGKGANDTDESLDNDFEHTNRYIRESVYDLVELQKFLMRLHISYNNYRQAINAERNPRPTGAERLKMTLNA